MSLLVVSTVTHTSRNRNTSWIWGGGDGHCSAGCMKWCGIGHPAGRCWTSIREFPSAFDFNEKALVETSRTLAGIEHINGKGRHRRFRWLCSTRFAPAASRNLIACSTCGRSSIMIGPIASPRTVRQQSGDVQVAAGIYIHSDCDAIPPSDMIQSTVEATSDVGHRFLMRTAWSCLRCTACRQM